MAKGQKTGGRKKGTPNKLVGASQHFRDAWEKAGGQKLADELLEIAVNKAKGYEVVEKTLDRKGKVAKQRIRWEYNFDPLAVLLPYMAKKMPVSLEGVEDGEPIKIQLIPFTNANGKG